jgi:hypothetical protein
MAAKDEKARMDKPQGQESPTPTPPASSKPPASSPEPPKAEMATRADMPGAIGLEQIREILFGALFRELERRLARADVHMSTRTKELEQEARRRTEVLEGHLRVEVGALATRVEHAFVEAAEALRNVARENRDAIAALEKRVAKAEEAGVVAQRELRTQLLDQAKSFLDELQHLRTELLTTLQEELAVPESELVEERGGAEERPRH